jgi:cyanophycinase
MPHPLLRTTALLLCTWLLPWCASAQSQGTTVAIGGALQDNNAAVWQRLTQLVGQGADPAAACYSIITIASAEPEPTAGKVAQNLARHGGRGEHLRVGPRLAGTDLADPRWVQQLRRCRGVYMTGGAQARLLDALMPAGQPGPLLLAMRELHAQGGVVAGSSAGAAVLSAVVFRDAPDVLAVMKGRLREGQEWGRGFAFTPPGVVVDQHAVRRGRMGRLLPLMVAQQATLGVAVEEDTAAVFSGTQVEALGAKGLLLADLAQAGPGRKGAFNLSGGTLHWLESGDRFDITQRQVQPAPSKSAGTRLWPLSPTHRGYHPGARFYSDILGEGMLVAALMRLVDGDQTELRGLAAAVHTSAASALTDPAPELGFEWRLWLDKNSSAWLTTSPEAYTISGVRFDIVPVQVRQPPYQALQGHNP